MGVAGGRIVSTRCYQGLLTVHATEARADSVDGCFLFICGASPRHTQRGEGREETRAGGAGWDPSAITEQRDVIDVS